jgi:alcohol dehydrogenase class IV
MHAGIALRDHGLYLGHAMAQALGGRYGLPHGALNAICLPAAMRFNGATEPIGVERVEELARLCGFTSLRDLEVPEGDLREIAEATAVRGGAQANPRPASVDQIEELLLSIW